MKTLHSLVAILVSTETLACSSGVQDLGDHKTSPDAGTTVTEGVGTKEGGDDASILLDGWSDLDASFLAPDGWDDFDASAVATSSTTPPWGIWSMSVQYGPVGVAVTPTVPMQVEMRPDGTAYSWICVGAPDDGSLTKPCATVARTQCMTGSNAWNGTRWRVNFAAIAAAGLTNQGNVTPDGNGNIMIAYIDPSYSGALFRKVGNPAEGTACTP